MNEERAAVDHYLAQFPQSAREKMEELRGLIRSVSPQATEKISYLMPSFFLGKRLVHYAGYTKHIGFYPGASTITTFAAELTDYKIAKGTIQFPLDRPLPAALIRKIVKFRVEENERS